jgi:hypothetical protein
LRTTPCTVIDFSTGGTISIIPTSGFDWTRFSGLAGDPVVTGGPIKRTFLISLDASKCGQAITTSRLGNTRTTVLNLSPVRKINIIRV